jgi:TonB-linked SusC/RagA family outer membrane protein
MKKFLLLLTVLIAFVGVSLAQRTVTGTITDEKGESLLGASVVVKGTTIGTVTDLDGKYSLTVPANTTTLQVSFTGYSGQDVSIGNSSVVDVKMAQGVLLTETVVTALGISKSEKSIGYAQQTVSGADITKMNTTNVIDALAGQVSGVQVTSASGAAGASSRIVIRGQTTLDGDNQALMVIDGIRIDNSTYQTQGSTGGVAQSNRGIDINPNDIESISVLKGASASALYGVEGAKGVVIITTKKGSSKKKGIGVEFSSTYTVSQITQTQGLQKQFAKGTGGALKQFNTTTSTSWGPNVDSLYYDKSGPNDYDKNGFIVGQSSPNSSGQKINVYDPYSFFQKGHGLQTNLALTSNLGDNSSVRTTFGNSNEDGIVALNNFQRTTAGLSTRSSFLDNKLRISTSFNYVYSTSRRIQQGSNISGLMLGLLRTPVTFDNSYGLADPVNADDGTGRNPAIYLSDGRQRTYRNGSGYDNPYWVVSKNPYTDKVNRFYGNFDITYEFSKLFQINTKFGTDTYSDARTQSFEINSRSFPEGNITDDKYNFNSLDAYLNILGNTNIGDNFTFGYTVGANHYEKHLFNTTIVGDALAFPGFVSFNNVGSVNTGLFRDERKNFGLYGVLNFGYKNWLYLDLTGRNDWNSTLTVPNAFDANAISFFYPSVSTSIVFSEWIPKNDALNFGKLRASYGVVGGGAPFPYQTSTPYVKPAPGDGYTNGITFPFNGTVGYLLSQQLGSTTLKASKTTDLEVGVELKGINNRVTLNASYYTRKSIDQILAVPVASTSGASSAILNSGQLSTKGYDVTLGLVPIKTKDFRWDVNMNLTHFTTIVDKLAEGVNQQALGGFGNPSISNFVGQPYGQIYGGAWQRTNSADGKTFDANLPYNSKGQIVIDATGRPIVDNQFRVIGNPNPDFILGINNRITYKGFSVSDLIDIRQGGQIWNGTRGALNNFGRTAETANRGTSIIYPGVTSDGSVNTKSIVLDQAWYQSLGTSFGAQVENFVEDASSARLRTLTVAYSFSPNMLKDMHMQDLTLSFTGRNLWLKTNNTGIDPETSLTGNGNAQGFDYFNMPGTKSWAFGLSVKF